MALRDLGEAQDQLARIAYADRINLVQAHWQRGRIDEARQLLANCPENLRGWEWFYFSQNYFQEKVILRGHAKSVWAVAFSPDGTRLATASDDTNALVWDAATAKH
jgi:WD40 repeat protein